MVKPHSRDACCPPRPALRVPSLGHRAPLFRALGDPTRLDIVALLAAAGSELCACDIEAHFELAQSTISHHLRILRDAGWITGARRGYEPYDPYNERLAAIDRWRAFMEQQWEQR